MKALKSSLAALILIAHCYVPAVAAISALSERALRFNDPLTASILTFILTVAISSYLFIDPKDVTPTARYLVLFAIPVSCVNFGLYIAHGDSTLPFVLSILSLLSLVILITRLYKRLLLRILIPAVSVILAAAVFVVSLVLAIAISFGRERIIYSELSPDRSFVAEIVSDNAFSSTRVNITVRNTDSDVTLPFIQIIGDGRVIWSGKIEYPASDSEDVTLTWPSGSPIDRLWLDNGTVIADGEEITVR